eukprot:308805-Chlamydomonas_euryale.AAC.1
MAAASAAASGSVHMRPSARASLDEAATSPQHPAQHGPHFGRDPSSESPPLSPASGWHYGAATGAALSHTSRGGGGGGGGGASTHYDEEAPARMLSSNASSGGGGRRFVLAQPIGRCARGCPAAGAR